MILSGVFEVAIELALFLVMSLLFIQVGFSKGRKSIRYVFLLLSFVSMLIVASFFIQGVLDVNLGFRLSFVGLLLFPAEIVFLTAFSTEKSDFVRKFFVVFWFVFLFLAGFGFFVHLIDIQGDKILFDSHLILFLGIVFSFSLFFVVFLLWKLNKQNLRKEFFVFASFFILFGLVQIGLIVFTLFSSLVFFSLYSAISIYLFNVGVFFLLIRYRYLDYSYKLVRVIVIFSFALFLYPVFFFLIKWLEESFNLIFVPKPLEVVFAFAIIYVLIRLIMRLGRHFFVLQDSMHRHELYVSLTDYISSTGYGSNFFDIVLDVLARGTESSEVGLYVLKGGAFVSEFIGEKGQVLPTIDEQEVREFAEKYSYLSHFRVDEEKLQGSFVDKLRKAGVVFVSFCRFSGETVGFSVFLEKEIYFAHLDINFIEEVLNRISAYLYFAIQKEKYETKQQYYQTLSSDLRTTRGLQEKMIPGNCILAGRFDIVGLNRPAQDLSGDFYDYFMDRSGNLVYYLADVSGKNVSAAMVMIFAKVVLRLNLMKGEELAFSLSEINRMIYEEFSMGYFLTAFVGRIRPNLTMEYSCAGHEYPFLLRENESPRELDTRGRPIGILEDSQFEVKEIEIKEDDTLFLYTDGVIDAVDFTGEFFGRERIKQSVNALHRKKRDASVVQIIDKLIQSHTGTEKQFDDISLMSLRVLSNDERKGGN